MKERKATERKRNEKEGRKEQRIKKEWQLMKRNSNEEERRINGAKEWKPEREKRKG